MYETVEELDTSGIENKYGELGQNTYHPRILLKLLLYGYTTVVRSGRKIAARYESDTAYMYLAEMYQAILGQHGNRLLKNSS
ncbi:MAG: transposase [Deltaproteobacteria bacterium]|nr:transposase [Deltaproteobacteria bacterium]